MLFEYVEYDEAHYSYNIRFNENRGTLSWDSAPRQDALLVQGPFRAEAEKYMNKICQRMDVPFPEEGKYIPIERGIYIRYVSSQERARNNGCPLNGRACTYTVFSCEWLRESGKDSLRIYAPNRRPMNPVSCDIPQKLRVAVFQVPEEVGFFQRLGQFFSRREQLDSSLYKVSIQRPDDFLADDMEDGIVRYRIEKFEYPVLKEIIWSGGFFVRAQSRPQIISGNPGLEIETLRSVR